MVRAPCLAKDADSYTFPKSSFHILQKLLSFFVRRKIEPHHLALHSQIIRLRHEFNILTFCCSNDQDDPAASPLFSSPQFPQSPVIIGFTIILSLPHRPPSYSRTTSRNHFTTCTQAIRWRLPNPKRHPPQRQSRRSSNFQRRLLLGQAT